MGYANAVIHLKFPELSEDPAGDPIWVAMRNPRMMPAGELQQNDVPTGDDGKPLDPQAGMEAMYERMAKVIIGLRAYDPMSVAVNADTGEMLPQQLLQLPITVDLMRRLPMEITNRVAEEFSAALNPKSDPATPTLKTSTPSPSVSTTELGDLEPSLVNSSTSS